MARMRNFAVCGVDAGFRASLAGGQCAGPLISGFSLLQRAGIADQRGDQGDIGSAFRVSM